MADEKDIKNNEAAQPDGENVIFSVKGKMSTFGGPHDLGMTPSEGLALFSIQDLEDPKHRLLFLPSPPPGTTGIGRRLNPDKFYLACRWDYDVTSRQLLRNIYARVTNPVNGKTFLARPVDWGPNAKTGRMTDLSPGLAAALGLNTDQIAYVSISTSDLAGEPVFASAEFAEIVEPHIYTTADWGARPARRSQFAEAWAEGIVIHNTEYANRKPADDIEREKLLAFENAREIQRGHFQRGWADTGQHFTISQGGLMLEGRHGSLKAARDGHVVQSAHAGDTHINNTWFGIELAGDNRQEYVVTDQQWQSAVELCAWLCKWRNIAELPIIGHKQVHSTSCPGKIMDHLDKLRSDVKARRQQLG